MTKTIISVGAALAIGATASAEPIFTPTNLLVDLGLSVSTSSIYNGGFEFDTTGDSYTTETLIQDGINAFFLENSTGEVFTMGAVAAPGGLNLFYNSVEMRTVSADVPLGGGVRRAIVETAAVDVAAGGIVPWVPANAGLSPNGVVWNSWRMDVGSTAGGPDPIDIPLAGGESVNYLGSGFTAFDSTGSPLGTFALTVDTSGGAQVSGLAVLGLGGGDIAGFDVGSIQLFWDYEIVPAPASVVLLGLGGLAAARRRR